jgi:hypothetical protein
MAELPPADFRAGRKVIRIPNPLRHWPWPRAINSHYEERKRESDAWFASFHAFNPKAQVAFNKCNFSLLGAMAYAALDRGRGFYLPSLGILESPRPKL